MRQALVVLMALALVVTIAPAASAKFVPLEGGEIWVHQDVENLWLRPGETDTYEIQVENGGDRQLNVSLDYLKIECPGGTSGEFSTSFFTLAPGERESITVEVTSHANMVLSRCLDESTVMISYGQNLTKETASDWDAADFHDIITHQLYYDPTYEILAVVIIVGLIGFVIYRQRVKRRDK